MKYKIILLICILTTALHTRAQIGINTETPHASTALEISAYDNDKGLFLPRMTTAQKIAIASPAPSLMVYDTDLKCISQYKDSQFNVGIFGWTCLTLYNRHWFYMPSINVPTSDGLANLLVGTQTIDLFDIYSTRFTSPMAKSTTAPTSILTWAREQLSYYITYHDPCISVSGISNAGILTYTVNNLPDYDAYMNIVFTVR